MPPVSFETSMNEFVPEYSSLFLCDSFYVDAASVERISDNPFFEKHRMVLDALRMSGRLKIEDFAAVVSPYEKVINVSVKHDMQNLDEWVGPFSELVSVWERYTKQVKRYREMKDSDFPLYRFDDFEWFGLGPPMSRPPEKVMLDWLMTGMYSGLDSYWISEMKCWKELSQDELPRVTDLVYNYLQHVSANLCLCDTLDAIIHDWEDIEPLYRMKLSTSVRVQDQENLEKQEQAHQLFTLMFPKFQPMNAEQLAEKLSDKRINALRQLIDEAVAGNVIFDKKFAQETFAEVFKIDKNIKQAKIITGWVTKPLSFVPWVGFLLPDLVNTMADKLVTQRMRRKKAWFYLLSDMQNQLPEGF
jgi:hypothetical protein